MFARLLNLPCRLRPAVMLGLGYLFLCQLLRGGLLVANAGSAGWGWSTLGAMFSGLGFDLAMACLFALPIAWLGAIWPAAWWSGWRSAPLHLAWCGGLWLLTFFKVSEILFWSEFGVRFNFIAVDYLVYTTEVAANIHQSYPLPAILGGITVLVVAAFVLLRRSGLVCDGLPCPSTGRARWGFPAALSSALALLLVAAWGVGRQDSRSTGVRAGVAEELVAGLRHMGSLQPDWSNVVDTELGKNGEYAFLAAFWSNKLPWAQFYLSGDRPVDDLRREMAADGVLLNGKDVTCAIPAAEHPRRLNVIQITVESLSAKYVGAFGVLDAEDGVDYGKLGLTPNLDRLARESLWFGNAFAGGTRTVRGMEALTLSIPPIPGQSVLRRDGCERLGTLGSALARNGYDTAFIYGGDGFFDNMSYFFSANGYRVVDRPAQEARGVTPTFANAWGACDEDALAWSVAEADRAHAEGRPFHHFIMTTSNHRPYTWPEGRIPPSLKGRHGGVAYTDHAIGAFLESARSKPWFKDTVFVIVADHGASVAGKRELEVAKYHIPMLIWSPAHIAPRRVDHLVAQVDLAPTLMALLGLPHTSTFLGADALSPAYRPRAFISNYQKVGLVRDGILTVLKPVRQVAQYEVDLRTGALRPLAAPRPDLIEAARAYYQGADDLFAHGKLRHDDGPR